MNQERNSMKYFIRMMICLSLFVHSASYAEETTPKASPAAEVDVDKIRERYWAQGRQSEMGVIQKRLFPLEENLEFSLGGGLLIGDPFLDTKVIRLSLGYHFSSLFSVHGIFQSASSQPSTALETLQSFSATADTNLPKQLFGLEGRINVAHGKLASIGEGMFFLDSFVILGFGSLTTETGSSTVISLGIGEQFRIENWIAINLDYRLYKYKESLVGKNAGNLGQDLGSRNTISHGITLGASFFVNFLN